LWALGGRTLAGDLVGHGAFIFNWHPDPDGSRLRLALSGRDGGPAWASVERLLPWKGPAHLGDVGIVFARRPGSDGTSAGVLAVHRSPPLVRILKWFNDYSNNCVQLLAEHIGGASAVQARARADLPPALRDEVVIDNAAGAGETNRMSPRAAVGLLHALDAELKRRGL